MATKEELKQIFVTGAIPKQTDFHNLIDVAGKEGPQGPRGEAGAKGDTDAIGAKGDTGEQGPQGDAGTKESKGDTYAQCPADADGFSTETQYNNIIGSMEALEAAE